MKRKIVFTVFFILTVLAQKQGFAQVAHSQKFLVQIGIADTLFSEILNEEREIWVKFPEYYNTELSKKYPVVYVLDGGVQLKTLATVCANYEGHYLPDMFLVGISNRNNRTRDLTTSEVKMRYGFPVREETGGAEKFTQFIEKELIPFIEKKYPTTSYRTLVGHSYGGLFTINTLINHKNLFENYIAIDPSLDWDNQKLLKTAKEKLLAEDFTGKSLFVTLSAGSLHMQKEEITLDNIMQDTSEYTLFARSIIEFSEFTKSQKQNDLNFSWSAYKNDIHGTVPLPSMRDGLIFLFEWYQLQSFWKFNNPETPVNELVELIKKREKILTAHFGYPSVPMEEELLNMSAYMALQSGQPEKAYAFFKLAIDYFPESANAYDSMADYYEAQNDFENAQKNVEKAFELSGKDYYKNRIEEFKEKKK